MAKKPRFNLRNATDDPALILLVFRYSGKRVVYSTGISIPRKYWNENSQRVKETKAFRPHRKINNRLNRLEAQTLDLHYDYIAMGVTPSPAKFKEALKAKLGNQEEGQPTLIEFIKLFIEEREAMKRPKGSIQVYKTCLKHLEEYLKARKKAGFDFDQINEAFKNDFIAYLFSKDFTDTHVHKILSTLKTFLKDAYKRGMIPQDVTAKVKLSIPKREVQNIYLTEKEVEALYHLEGLSERLANVRDLFLIGCLTGLRFSDFTQIKPENIKPYEHKGKEVVCIAVTTKKTKQRIYVPLVHPMLKAILARHGMAAPKAISNQKMNKYLKELAQLAGLEEPVEKTEYRAGKATKKVVPKWELVTSHTARRSFATNAYKRGIPVPDIMKFTGHKTTVSFMKYIKVTGEETAVVLAEHSFFTGKSPLKAIK